jgi:SRSO17 transposase
MLSVPAENILSTAPWKKVSWRRGTKGSLSARFAALRIRIADGQPQRILDKGQQHMPGEEAWVVGEWRSSGERKYYLSNLPANTSLKSLAAAIKARWVCEQAHQQMKEELGLDHFEGRSWQGLHRHALMTMIAYAFLQHQRLQQAKRKKKKERGATAADHASHSVPDHQGTLSKTTLPAMPALQNASQAVTQMNLPK